MSCPRCWLLTCGRDEEGCLVRGDAARHGEVGQVGEGDEEGEGGHAVRRGHQQGIRSGCMSSCTASAAGGAQQ